jgi:hypothetical protein
MISRIAAVLITCMWTQVLHVQAQASCTWSLEETLRIGSVGGEDALSSVVDLTIGPAGDVYVAQEAIPNVTVFAADGSLSRVIGRAGRGPGEFDGAPVRLGWLADTLWVSDFGATHFFGLDGTEARQVSFYVRLASEGSFFRPGAALSDGTLLGYRLLGGGISQFYAADSLSVLRFSPSGDVLDTIARIAQPLRVQRENSSPTEHPLDDWAGASGLPVVVTPDGSSIVYVGTVRADARNPSFDLLKLSIFGDTLLQRAVAYEPRPLTESDRDWLRDAFAARMAGDYVPSSTMIGLTAAASERIRAAATEAITFPEFYPPVRRIVAGRDGSMWLLRELTLPDRVDRWELYDADGAFRGAVSVRQGRSALEPWWPRLDVLAATSDEIWGVTLDELDVPYIHRYRIDKGCD